MHKTIDGVRLAYDDVGAGATALVLLHGFPFDRTIWDEVLAPLARLARIVRIDLRGSGESACGDGPALMETLAGDVFGLLDALDLGHAIVAGHSMGGYVGLAFFRMYAERVAGLALIASHVGADTPGRALERDRLAAVVDARGMAALAGPIVSAAVAPAFHAAHPAVVARLQGIVARQNPLGAGAQIIGMKERVDSSDLLEDIAVPALIVGGGSDSLVPPGMLETIAGQIADCEFVRIEGVAHLPMIEAPEITTAALQRLIERCETIATDRQNARATRA